MLIVEVLEENGHTAAKAATQHVLHVPL